MRAIRSAVLIIGLFQPLVIQAQPFGETDVKVFDTDFLSAPPGPPAPRPTVPPLPDWIDRDLGVESAPTLVPAISILELTQ